MKSLIRIFYFLLLICIIGCSKPPVDSSFRNKQTGLYKSVPITKGDSIFWKFKTKGMIFSSATLDETHLYFGSDDGNIYALDKSTGKLKWIFKTGGMIRSTPAIYGNRLVFISMDGYAYCLNKDKGTEIWKIKTHDKIREETNFFGFPKENGFLPDYWDVYQSSPYIKENIVYLGSGNGQVYAIDLQSGNMIWEFKTGNVVHSSPLVYEGKVFVGSFDSKIYALNALTGEEIWSFQSGIDSAAHIYEGIQASPTIFEGKVYIGSRDANFYAFDANSGEIIWKTFCNYSWVPSSAAVTDSFIYAGSSDAQVTYKINRRSGEMLGIFPTNFLTFSSPAVIGNYMYIGVSTGRLFCFNTEDLSTQFVWKTDACLKYEGKYFDEAGKYIESSLEEFDFNTSEGIAAQIESMYIHGSIYSSPVIDSGIIYFGATDSCFYALGDKHPTI